jgi:hypothetical protein
MVSLEHTLHDQVRNLRFALSDLKTQVSDLAAAFGREVTTLLNETNA